MELGTLGPILLALAGVAGAIFAALRFNREDASAVVAQQSTVLSDMRTLNAEIATSASRIREERDDLLAKIVVLTAELAAVRVEVELLRHELEHRPPAGRRETDRR